MGEADRILTLLTPDRGKIRVIAKGIRKLTSRKAGHLELLSRASLLLAHGRELNHITQAQVVDAYPAVREDLTKTAYASYFVELLDRFTAEQQEAEDVFQLLRDALTWLGDSPESVKVARYFELRLLALSGFQPELRRCLVTGAPIAAEDQFFWPVQGGVVSPAGAEALGPRKRELLPIGVEPLRFLRYFQREPLDKAARAKVPAPVLAEMEYILQRYIVTLLERQLKSVEFIRVLRQAVDGGAG
jgi:DNA repair protein RecO (recombination protein O)